MRDTPTTTSLWIALVGACNEAGVPIHNAGRIFDVMNQFRELELTLREKIRAFHLVTETLKEEA